MRALLALLFALVPVAASADDARALALGRELTSLFYERKADAVWSRMAPQMQGALRNQAGLEQFREQLAAQLGTESDVVEERVAASSGMEVYIRRTHWSQLPGQVFIVQWAFDASGKVSGFFVRPEAGAPAAARAAAPSKYLDYETRARLRLPFGGEWLVFWGGRTIEQNYHVVDRGQRFAYDILIVRDGKSHDGDGKSLDQYYSFGQPILAPAKGIVASVVDGLPDQVPGKQDPAHPPGNHVVLDLGSGEYALLAHLKQGSVKVKTGDAVEPGQPLGLCGNSGNTTEPHLHFHLQDAPRFGEGEGLPAFFNDYVADGKPVKRGEPVKGERIRARE